jgi:hypothetical protein
VTVALALADALPFVQVTK